MSTVAAKLTALNPPRKRAAEGGVVFAAILFAILAVVVALGIYVGIPLALGILVFPALLGLTGWGVFLSTVASFAGVWLVLGALNRLNK
ncbi:hypothetical protein MTE01_29140 [Microbacterium testaceum]|uniref:Uncharacterized protein n=1 Tax=Microbacterium testaceum TaxID=2033 RepID=A0A4Y3QPY3_MICTE|nr:hypothetical protein [Microbacterium testaceum]GEB46969.1 hypothetical protein MTE01_29140 [Microbacterium testaceum]